MVVRFSSEKKKSSAQSDVISFNRVEYSRRWRGTDEIATKHNWVTEDELYPLEVLIKYKKF